MLCTSPPLPPSCHASSGGFQWAHRFHALGSAFASEQLPTPLPSPYWVGRNQPLAQALGLPTDWLSSPEALAALSGNQLLAGSRPLAMVYSGHQFGVWAGQLGDGRAILLGDTESGLEIQLKGAGRTPYSRGGDGRAVLRSSIREFLCSAAMQGLGIPSTQALCVTGSPAGVQREVLETAAVVTRVAPSFVRFGHFEHFAATGQLAPLRQLADWVITRWYPECQSHTGEAVYAAWLQAVTQRTAELMAQWQAVGFCHGVMNTDNMSILGLTLDYGPFQFMDAFDPAHICNHSDHRGRYAWQNQPQIAQWNLFCLAQALLPLIPDQDQVLAALATYGPTFQRAQREQFGAKLGLAADQVQDRDDAWIEHTLTRLAQDRVDYPLFWRGLGDCVAALAAGQSPEQAWQCMPDGVLGQGSGLRCDQGQNPENNPEINPDNTAGQHWQTWWQAMIQRLQGLDLHAAAARMHRHNPRYVLRNYLAEQAIDRAKQGDMDEVQTLLMLLQSPFDEHPAHADHARLPPAWAGQIAISCSS